MMTEPMTEAEFINVVKREAFQRFGHAGQARVLRACAEAPATDTAPTLDIGQIVLDVCELPGDVDPNDPDALTLTVAELRIVLEREAERLRAEAPAPTKLVRYWGRDVYTDIPNLNIGIRTRHGISEVYLAADVDALLRAEALAPSPDTDGKQE